MAGPFYFAWVDASEVAFNPGVHIREDQIPISLSIDHSEGLIPRLTVTVKNTGAAGLLTGAAKQWVWLSWDNGSTVTPLFHGRIIGIPQNLHLEAVDLTFTARAADYQDQQLALALSLQVSPYWDPIWLTQNADPVDTALEARSAVWHVDRVTNAVTISDIIAGEDGTIDVAETEHSYGDLGVSYNATPLTRVSMTATVTWTQAGSGDVDVAQKIWQAFQDAGDRRPFPLISSLTYQGLLDDWPKAGDALGGGWTIGEGTGATDVTAAAGPPVYLSRNYLDIASEVPDPAFAEAGAAPNTTVNPLAISAPDAIVLPTTQVQYPSGMIVSTSPNTLLDATTGPLLAPKENWTFNAQLGALKISAFLHYEAARSRAEIVTFDLNADVQPLMTDPGDAETESVQLNSDQVGLPVDPDGGIPIGDLRRRSYFLTDRGRQSFEYLLALCRAKLLDRARAIDINFTGTWNKFRDISCRQNVTLHDRRLPGGQVTGKVKSYSMKAGAQQQVQVTISCTVGAGNSLPASDAGTGVYAAAGYMQTGYQQITGRDVELIAGDISYEDFGGFSLADDGLDLFNMTADQAVTSVVLTGSPDDQTTAVDAGLALVPPDPAGALKDAPTTITLNTISLGGSFQSTFAPVVSALMVPKTIDLAATG